MFFKKKAPVPQNQAPNLGPVFIALATELYRGIGSADGTASLSATLEFDNEQRVAKIQNPQVNGAPKVPSFETIENLNEISSQLKSLPKKFQLKSLNVSIQDGQINADAVYAEN